MLYIKWKYSVLNTVEYLMKQKAFLTRYEARINITIFKIMKCAVIVNMGGYLKLLISVTL